MNEQQQECYGIPYAMYNHDIERIETRYNEDDYGAGNHKVLGANTLLRINGWVLLAIGQQGNMEHGLDPLYIMGVPRPKFCRTCGVNGGRKVQLVWRHWDKQWVCKDCAHAWALDIERKRQQPQTDSD